MPADHRVSLTHGRPDLAFLRKRAKLLLKALHRGEAPEQRAQLLDLGRPGPDFQLADTQWLVAREVGFSSWPKLKAHADALDFAARHPHFQADDEATVEHWRCGNDIEHSLHLAGFQGRFRMYADPMVMGPVRDLPDEQYTRLRLAYLEVAFAGMSREELARRQGEETAALARLDASSQLVLWCEADAYDQLFLVRVLAKLRQVPRRLELVEVAQVPGVQRFVGIGQLAPDVLAWLWPQRRSLGEEALALAREAWAAYTAQDPRPWAELARRHHPSLPLLGPALARQLQELPGARDGLSLTERLTLRVVAEQGELTSGRVFGRLMMRDEPLPYLGDLMFHALLRPLIDGPEPLLAEGPGEAWARRTLQLTALGERVLAGQAHWLDHQAPERWVGGVRVVAGQVNWVVDDGGQVSRR